MNRRSFYIVSALVFALMTGIVSAQEAAQSSKDLPVAEKALQDLDAEITEALASGRWSEASVAFCTALWESFKKAHQDNKPRLDAQSLEGLGVPQIKDYNEYAGSYARAEDPNKTPFIEILRDEEGRLTLKFGENPMPAIGWNSSILSTTGDVVQSKTPNLAEKPHAAFEWLLITRVNGEYYLADPEIPSQHRKIIKVDEIKDAAKKS